MTITVSSGKEMQGMAEILDRPSLVGCGRQEVPHASAESRKLPKKCWIRHWSTQGEPGTAGTLERGFPSILVFGSDLQNRRNGKQSIAPNIHGTWPLRESCLETFTGLF